MLVYNLLILQNSATNGGALLIFSRPIRTGYVTALKALTKKKNAVTPQPNVISLRPAAAVI